MKIIDNMRKIFTLSILPMVSLSLSSCSNIYIYKELKDKFEPYDTIV